MVERAVSPYSRLFEARLLHHYWLDTGKTMFDALAAPDQDERLLTYDVRALLTPDGVAISGTGHVLWGHSHRAGPWPLPPRRLRAGLGSMVPAAE